MKFVSRLVFPMLIRILSVWLMIIYLRIAIFPPKTRITWCQCVTSNHSQSLNIMICVVLCCQFYQYNWDNSMCVTIKHSFLFMLFEITCNEAHQPFFLCPSMKSTKDSVTWWLLIRFDGFFLPFYLYQLWVTSVTRYSFAHFKGSQLFKWRDKERKWKWI